VLGDLGDKSLLVVGAGRIGLQTLVKAAQSRRVRGLAVANRTKARAEEVAARFDADAFGLDEPRRPSRARTPRSRRRPRVAGDQA
jgi:glutamyl-tRNA reductase